jgi:hypothetical protein
VIVNMSQMTVAQMTLTSTEESRQQRLFWVAEQIMNWSGVPVVHVRPTVLLDNPLFTVLARRSVRERDVLLADRRSRRIRMRWCTRTLAEPYVAIAPWTSAPRNRSLPPCAHLPTTCTFRPLWWTLIEPSRDTGSRLRVLLACRRRYVARVSTSDTNHNSGEET